MLNRAQLIAGIISGIVILLVISKLATGSLNPVEIFRGDSLLLKIVAGFIMLSLVGSALQLLMIKRFIDKDCACAEPSGCGGKSLVGYGSAFGAPVRCAYCERWFHQKCFKVKGGGLTEGCKQPGCRSYVGPGSFFS